MLASQNERRRMQRCPVEEPVTIKFWDHGPREITAMVYNASPDGVFLETAQELPLHFLLDLIFLFPATLRSPGVRFVCKCRIVRRTCHSPGRFGVAVAILRTESERIALRHTEQNDLWEPTLVPGD